MKLIRNAAFFLIIFMSCLFLCACMTRTSPAMSGISFKPDDITITKLKTINNGIGKSAETSSATYYFLADSNDDENIHWAENADIVLQAAHKAHGLERSKTLSLYFVTDGVFLPPSNMFVNTDNADSIGAVFQQASSHRLPAWLCTGLELYWLDRFGDGQLPGGFVIEKGINVNEWLDEIRGKNLPEFGELWFLPEYVTDESVDQARNIAFAFVDYLFNSNQIEKMIDFYLDNWFPSHLDVMEMDAWTGFFGEGVNTAGYETNYYAAYGVSINNIAKTYFFVTTDYVTCYFGNFFYSGVGNEVAFDYNVIERYVSLIDDCYQFVTDWFGYDRNSIVDVVLDHGLANNNEALAYTGGTDNSRLRLLSETSEWACLLTNVPYDEFTMIIPIVASHELTHALTRNNNERSSYPNLWLEEGLCEIVKSDYAIDRGFQYLYVEVSYSNELAESHRADTEAAFTLLSGKSMYESPADVYYFHHALALLGFNAVIDEYGEGYFDKVPGIRSAGANAYKNIRYIHSYGSANSFVTYLASVGTKEDLRAFYKDYKQSETIYGKDIDSLIADWLAFLSMEYIIQ